MGANSLTFRSGRPFSPASVEFVEHDLIFDSRGVDVTDPRLHCGLLGNTLSVFFSIVVKSVHFFSVIPDAVIDLRRAVPADER